MTSTKVELPAVVGDVSYRNHEAFIPINVDRIDWELENHCVYYSQLCIHQAQAMGEHQMKKIQLDAEEAKLVLAEKAKEPKPADKVVDAIVDANPAIIQLKTELNYLNNKKTYLTNLLSVFADRTTMLVNIAKRSLDREG